MQPPHYRLPGSIKVDRTGNDGWAGAIAGLGAGCHLGREEATLGVSQIPQHVVQYVGSNAAVAALARQLVRRQVGAG